MLLAPRLWNCLTILRDASGSSPRRLSPVHFCSSASRWHYSRGTHLLFWGQLRWTSTMNFYHFNCLCILYYCITVSLYYCIIVLLYHCITVIVLLYHCITVSLYYCIIVLLYHCITYNLFTNIPKNKKQKNYRRWFIEHTYTVPKMFT